MRPIDADALSALLFKRMGKYETLANELPKNSYEGCAYYGKVTALYEAQLAIDRIIPTLDYAPVVRGEWIEGLKCSKCGQVDMTKPNFCPYCGAKNGGWKHDET